MTSELAIKFQLIDLDLDLPIRNKEEITPHPKKSVHSAFAFRK